MKTAEEWVQTIPDACDHKEWEGREGDSNCARCKEDDMTIHLILEQRVDFIKQIQLDAMKEAADIADKSKTTSMGDMPDEQRKGAIKARQAILTAVEQLT